MAGAGGVVQMLASAETCLISSVWEQYIQMFFFHCYLPYKKFLSVPKFMSVHCLSLIFYHPFTAVTLCDTP